MIKNGNTPRTVRDCADELNVSPFTIRSWIAQRKLGCLHFGRAVRVPASEIRRLILEGLTPALPSDRLRRKR
jgi:excisionase family DNA binding protein